MHADLLPSVSKQTVYSLRRKKMAVSILVYMYIAINGPFTTSVSKSPVHATGLHLPDAGSAVHMSPAGGQPLFSAYQLVVSALQ